jgi:hypothetical protein
VVRFDEIAVEDGLVAGGFLPEARADDRSAAEAISARLLNRWLARQRDKRDIAPCAPGVKLLRYTTRRIALTVLTMRRRRQATTPADDVADIAAAVPKPEALLEAEALRDQLEASRADIRRRLDVAWGDHERFGGSGAKAVVEAKREEMAIGAAIEANRRDLLAARRAYGADVAAALRPSAEDAATRILAALADAEAAIATLDAIEKLNAAAASRAAYPVAQADQRHLAAQCRRILAGGAGR